MSRKSTTKEPEKLRGMRAFRSSRAAPPQKDGETGTPSLDDSLIYYVCSLTGIVFVFLRVQPAMLPYTAFARDKFSLSLGATTCTSKEAPDARCVCKYAGYTA